MLRKNLGVLSGTVVDGELQEKDLETFVLNSREPVQYFRKDNGYTLSYILTDAQFDQTFHLEIKSTEDQIKRSPPKHTIARKLAGKRIRVTLEVLD